MPAKGQLVLLQDDQGPIAALRTRAVYKGYRFAGQVVRDYGKSPPFEIGSTYRAKFKVRDFEITDDEAQPVPPDDLDVELDRSRFADALSPTEELELNSLMIEEVDDYEQESSLLAYRVSIMRMPKFDKGWVFPAGTGLRFSQTVAHPIFLDKKRYQDALSLDINLQFTRLIEYTALGGDSFLMMPITFAGRYTLYTSSSFGFFVYAGATRNTVISSAGEEPDLSVARNLLSYQMTVAGLGLAIEIGPQWWLYLDLGTDQAGANLGIKF